MKKKTKITHRRKWARFKVKSERKLDARIVQGIDRMSRLRTLSLGGCSFLSRRGDAKLLLNPNVKVSLTINGKPVTVDGVVHYCHFVPQLGLDKNILGIEFAWPDDATRAEFGSLLGEAVHQGFLEQMSAVEV